MSTSSNLHYDKNDCACVYVFVGLGSRDGQTMKRVEGVVFWTDSYELVSKCVSDIGFRENLCFSCQV